MRCIAAHGKVLDYASVQMNRDWLSEIYGPDKVQIERESFVAFTRAAVTHGVRLAPGSDGHHAWWRGGPTRWFGNNAASYALLQARGYRDEQLWWGPGT